MKQAVGEDWKYINIAVNPFTIDGVPDFCLEQVTVAQVVLVGKEGVDPEGNIKLAKGMKIGGAKDEDSYEIFEYFGKLSLLNVPPTLIVLGPSLPHWSHDYNLERIERLLPLLRRSCEKIWSSLPEDRRDFVWKLSA